ncbi:MAG: hypothetical protein REI11_02210 [Patulibacter sp.]|nr:hypothetical protein [Patulibacter sp.]
MIFMFDLELGQLSDARGAAITDAVREANGWPVEFVAGRVEKRWFGVEKFYPPVLEILTEDDAGPILLPTATRDADAIALRPDAVAPLAVTVGVIADHSPEGFVFRATWSGSPILQDEHLRIPDLVRRIRASGLNEFTRYRVDPADAGPA